mmetsp:Transcript_30429/g.81848  ORF Transcript_30429/g.81848 Transcript_30429/m.81848 type:complete len:212 (-) Transcript_30429:1332-1967(-)
MDLRDHLHGVVELDGVLSQEAELELVVLVQCDVLDTQRAAAHRVRLLVRVLFVAHTQGELVDEVDGDGALLHLEGGGLEAPLVVRAHLADVLLELARLVVLGHVAHALPRGVGGKPDALVLPVDRVLPFGQPGDFVVVDHGAPFVRLAVPEVGHGGHGDALAYVDGDVLGHDPLLHLPALRVVASPAEEARGLDAKVAHLLLAVVDGGEDV